MSYKRKKSAATGRQPCRAVDSETPRNLLLREQSEIYCFLIRVFCGCAALKMAPSVGIEPTYQILQICANPSQLTWVKNQTGFGRGLMQARTRSCSRKLKRIVLRHNQNICKVVRPTGFEPVCVQLRYNALLRREFRYDPIN